MRRFIVEIVDPTGNRRWVFINAAGQSSARLAAEAKGYTVNQAFEENSFEVSDLLTRHENALAGNANAAPGDLLANIDSLGSVANIGSFAPPTGDAGGGLSGMGTPIRGGAEAQFGPMFRAGLADRGITLGGGGGIQGRLAEEARDPFFSRSLASAAFAAPPIEALGEEGARTAMPSFQEMVRTGALYGGGATQQARDLLRQAQGFGRDFRGRGALAGSILNPSTVEQGATLANIAREAGRQRYGSFARFLPQAPALSEAFFAQPDTPQIGNQTFADYLNQRIFGG